MDAVPLYALTGVLVVLVTRLRFDRAFGIVVGCLLLIPAYLLVPFTGFAGTRVTRIVFIAFALSFRHRIRTGEIDAAALRPPRLLLALIVAMGIIAVTGIGFAGTSLTLRSTFEGWLILVDQAVMLLIAVVATRTLGARRVIDTLLVVLGAVLAVAAWEYFAGRAWSQLFPVTRGQSRILLNPLEQRGGSRVRAGALFALELGWTIAILVPLGFQRFVGPLSARWRASLFALLGTAVTVLFWTRSRSALVAAAAALVVLLIVSGARRRMTWPIVAAALVVGVVVSSTNLVGGVYELDRPSMSTKQDVRVDRLPGILAEAAPHPYTGLGLGGLVAKGYVTPDDGWLLLYTDTGMIGLAAYAAVVLLAIVNAARALRAPPGPRRDLAAAVMTALLIWAGANAAYDAANLGLSGPLFWLLAGTAVVLGEQARPPSHPVATRRVLAAGAAVAMLVALMAPWLAPAHVARTYQFQDLPTSAMATSAGGYTRQAYSIEATVCDAMNALDESVEGHLTCVEPGVYEPNSGAYSVYVPGVGRMRSEAATTEQLDEIERQILAVGQHLIHFELRRTSTDDRGTLTAAATAPVWMALGLSLLIVFWPRSSTTRYGMLTPSGAPGGSGSATRARDPMPPPSPTLIG